MSARVALYHMMCVPVACGTVCDRICSSTWANVILQGVNGEFNCSGAGKDVDCCIWYRDLAGVLIVPSDEFTSASRMPYNSCAGAWNGELFIFV